MKANWNGLYFKEPRWKLSIHSAIIALLIQVGIVLKNKPLWDSFFNLTISLSLGWTHIQTDQVIHPGSQITSSRSIGMQSILHLILILYFIAGWFLSQWFWVSSFKTQ